VLLGAVYCLHMLLHGPSGGELSHERFAAAGGCAELRRAMTWALDAAGAPPRGARPACAPRARPVRARPRVPAARAAAVRAGGGRRRPGAAGAGKPPDEEAMQLADAVLEAAPLL
jgi:hypothetical protein